MKEAVLILSDGTVFTGMTNGTMKDRIGEVVFTTSTAYMETITDPCYTGKIVVFTSPMIGNVGTNQEDVSSNRVCVCGVVVRDLCSHPSNHRSEQTLQERLDEDDIKILCKLETRDLVKHLRKKGTLVGMITSSKNDRTEKLKTLRAWREPLVTICSNYECIGTSGFRVAVIDLGIKNAILRALVKRDVTIKSFTREVQFEEVMEFNPDGILISSGPYLEEEMESVVLLISELFKTGLPMFGIDLGHLLMAKANGALIDKMRYGCNGSNYSVLDQKTGRLLITTMTHQYNVVPESIPSSIEITHAGVEGAEIDGLKYHAHAFSVLFVPDADSALYSEFLSYMKESKKCLLEAI